MAGIAFSSVQFAFVPSTSSWVLACLWLLGAQGAGATSTSVSTIYHAVLGHCWGNRFPVQVKQTHRPLIFNSQGLAAAAFLSVNHHWNADQSGNSTMPLFSLCHCPSPSCLLFSPTVLTPPSCLPVSVRLWNAAGQWELPSTFGLGSQPPNSGYRVP